VDWELEGLEAVNMMGVALGRIHAEVRRSCRAVFDIKAKLGMFLSVEDGRHVWKFILAREKPDAPWIIPE